MDHRFGDQLLTGPETRCGGISGQKLMVKLISGYISLQEW